MQLYIEPVTRYRFAGEEYKTIGEVEQVIDDKLGALIDKYAGSLDSRDILNARQRLAMLEWLKGDHAQLATLLTIQLEPDDQLAAPVNIFDL